MHSVYARADPAQVLKSLLVNNRTSLCHLSVYYGLPDLIRGSKATETPSIQADVFEAYLAGLVGEQGYSAARLWTRKVFQPLVRHYYAVLKDEYRAILAGAHSGSVPARELSGPPRSDAAPAAGGLRSEVSILEEWRVQNFQDVEYSFSDRIGPPHLPTFECECRVAGVDSAFTSAGRTKKEAKTGAARKAVEHLGLKGF